jgi:hypothetical protein
MGTCCLKQTQTVLEECSMTEVAPIATINPWLHPLVGGDPPPTSERLIRALEAHTAASAADVVTYRDVAQRLHDPAAEMLIGMIVDDEQRHDALLRSMVRRLEAEVDFVAPVNALPVPNETALLDLGADGEIAASVRGLLRNEHEAARHVRHLARQEPLLYGGLYRLLLETIARDSEKHAAILRYLLQLIEEHSR